MDDKKAINILLGLINKYPLTKEEKDAVNTAIGVLSWTSLAQGRLKAIKDKREKSTKW